jgi:O-acetyl-ADP-ribose deacetylase (regulator of RNase III)/uncharacterized protein YwgA
MVRVLVGDLFASKAQTLVNTVNCVGIMGKGVALEFKKRFPAMYGDYVRKCKQDEVKLGRPYFFKSIVEPHVLNFPTKDHWRSVSRLDDIVRGLEYLQRHYKEWGITSLAVPPLGCGQGQLEWSVVGPTLYRYLSRLDIPVELYAPYGTPNAELMTGFLAEDEDFSDDEGDHPGHIEPGWIAVVEILARIEREPYRWPIGRTGFQKVVYFATECGIPTGMSFNRGSYGPFAPQLKRSIAKLVNNSLIFEKKKGKMLSVSVGPTYADARKTYRDLLIEWSSVIDKIVDLFLRINTNEAELAATVHFVATSLAQQLEDRPSEGDVLTEVMKWKQRRRPPIHEADVAATIRHLAMLSWIDVRPTYDLPISEEELLGV